MVGYVLLCGMMKAFLMTRKTPDFACLSEPVIHFQGLRHRLESNQNKRFLKFCFAKKQDHAPPSSESLLFRKFIEKPCFKTFEFVSKYIFVAIILGMGLGLFFFLLNSPPKEQVANP